MLMDGTIFKLRRRPLLLGHALRLGPRPLPQVASDRGSTSRSRTARRGCRTCRSRARKSREILAAHHRGHGRRRPALLPLRPDGRARRRRARAWSRARATRARSATRSTARRRTPSSSGTPCSRPASPTASGRSACRRSRPCASSPGCCSRTSTTSPHQTDPFEVRLDNVVKVDKPGDFVGKDALQRIAEQGTPRLLTTLRIDGDEVPEYGAAVTRDGQRRRHRAQPLPEPDVRHRGDRDGGRRPRAGPGGPGARRRARRRHGQGARRRFPLYDPGEDAPAVVGQVDTCAS